MKRGKAHVKWLNDYEAASSWMGQYNIKKLLKQGGGIAKISNFFPELVAEGILSDLGQIPLTAWNATEAGEDYRQNNISHSFQSVREAKGLDLAVRVLSLLLPEELNSFSAARYCTGDHIAPHDDRAYTQVCMEDGSIITTSRTIACIVYLTKDWKEEYGGLLLDLENPGGEPKTYVPQFNSAILFTIPRWHQVTPMTTSRPRYTLFGWFLKPGRLYELNLGYEKPPQQQKQQSTTKANTAVVTKAKDTSVDKIEQRGRTGHQAKAKPQSDSGLPAMEASKSLVKIQKQKQASPVASPSAEQAAHQQSVQHTGGAPQQQQIKRKKKGLLPGVKRIGVAGVRTVVKRTATAASLNSGMSPHQAQPRKKLKKGQLLK